MKASLLTAAALAGLLALSGCATASSESAAPPTGSSAAPAESATADAGAAAPSTSAVTEPSASSADSAAASASQGAASTDGKVHFEGDYTKTTAADSAKILELSKQWYSPEKEASLRAKMASAGLSSNIPADMAGEWYSRAATSCQAKFDGHPMTVQGAWVEIDKLVLATYCPELG